MHIPKTAGSSFRRILQYVNTALDREWCPTPQDEYFDYDTFSRTGAELVEKYEFVGGHYPFHCWEPYLGQAQLITVFRDPIERCLSHIKHQIEQYPPEDCPAEVNAFIEYPDNQVFLESLSDLHVKFLSYAGHPNDLIKESDISLDLAIENSQKLRYGLASNLDAFLAEIVSSCFEATEEQLLPIFQNRPPKRMLQSDQSFGVKDLTSSNLDRLAGLNCLDLAFYKAVSGGLAEAPPQAQ